MNLIRLSRLLVSLFFVFSAHQVIAEEGEAKLQSMFPNGIAAVVEDDIITVHQLRRQVTPLIQQIRLDSRSATEFDANLQRATREVLDSMIDRTLIVKEFERKQLQVPESFKQSEFRRTMLERFDGDRSKYIRYLQQEGKSDTQYKEELTDNIIVGFMEREMLKSLSGVSPQRIRDFYNENKVRFYQEEALRLRQIMLSPAAGQSEEELLAQANEIIAQLADGINFATLAEEKSTDDMASNGGDWGWVKRSDMRKELADVAFSMPEGTFSDPIVLDKYVFILFAEEKVEEGFKALDEVRDRIKEAITTREMREERRKWIERLRKDAFVKYYI